MAHDGEPPATWALFFRRGTCSIIDGVTGGGSIFSNCWTSGWLAGRRIAAAAAN